MLDNCKDLKSLSMIFQVIINILNTSDDLAAITVNSTITTEIIFNLAQVYPTLDHTLLELSLQILDTIIRRTKITEQILSGCLMLVRKGFEVTGKIDILQHCITIVLNLCN